MCVQSTRRHPAHPVSMLILHPRQIQALWSQNYGTEILRRNAAKGVANAMLCHRTGYDRHNMLFNNTHTSNPDILNCAGSSTSRSMKLCCTRVREDSWCLRHEFMYRSLLCLHQCLSRSLTPSVCLQAQAGANFVNLMGVLGSASGVEP